MTNKTRLSLTLSVAILMWACGGDGRSLSPTSPSAPPAVATYTLTGIVSAMTPTGLAPVEGVGCRSTL
jgi:hypothetical protein